MKTCFYCQKEIKKGQEYCSLISYDKKDKVSHEAYFHRECFRKWIEEKVDNRVKQLAKTLQEQAMAVVKAKFGDGGNSPAIFA